MRRVQPAKTASASAIEGRDGSKDGVDGISCVNSLALAALPSVIPLFRLRALLHSDAIFFQSVSTKPTGASGCERL